MRTDHFGNVLPGTMDDTFNEPLAKSGPVWWPVAKLLADFACLALAMGALLAWGMVG